MRKTFFLTIVISIVIAESSLYTPSAGSNPMAAVRLGINRYTTVSLSDARADQIIADGIKFLNDNDGTGDVSCPIELVRDGAVSSFTAANGIINSQADYNAVCATGGRVHLVTQINYCGGPGANIVGCADTPGSCMIFVRMADQLEGILWMHEYGHNQGLPHRTNPFAVMDPVIDIQHKRVNNAECTLYQLPPAPAFLRGKPQPQRTQRQSADVESFVRQTFIHGVPYETASAFPSTVVPRLLRMLADPSEEQYWSNIVVTLGAIGDERAVSPLLQFFTTDEGRISDSRYRAKTAVLMSLGYLGNKSHNREAIRFLLNSLDPDVWRSRVKWIGSFPSDSEDQRVYLTKLAIWGLALTGTPEARDALLGLKSTARSTEARQTQERLGSVVDEALALHARVVRFGLIETYRQSPY
jgi:PBS lyase HEAT-like repeat-containing protein